MRLRGGITPQERETFLFNVRQKNPNVKPTPEDIDNIRKAKEILRDQLAQDDIQRKQDLKEQREAATRRAAEAATFRASRAEKAAASNARALAARVAAMEKVMAARAAAAADE
jgi:hypothetical protein